ncbi:MAG: MerR family DNA-binding transcriptional regulator [Chloroflexi bacterium]|nr:MerR family DNA-binding transcriptional regulator [Chloroflexota bacterium]
MKRSLRIGELAKATGLTTKAIRYYELLGLIPRTSRTESGYRMYPDQDVRRLEFIYLSKSGLYIGGN